MVMSLPSVPPELYLILSGILFTIGVIGALTRRNAIVVFMCIELMLNAVNLTFITFSRFLQSMDGVLFAFFVMAVAAAEAAVGLAIFVLVYRSRGTINVDEINLLKW
jgi:NADH-quinone oxidoreductase subunit K